MGTNSPASNRLAIYSQASSRFSTSLLRSNPTDSALRHAEFFAPVYRLSSHNPPDSHQERMALSHSVAEKAGDRETMEGSRIVPSG